MSYYRRYINIDLGNKIAYRLRNKLYRELLNKEPMFFN
jgi:hypothetical protein